MLVVVPPQLYVERLAHFAAPRTSPINFEGTYLEFLTGPWLTRGPHPEGNVSWHHLWFSLAALPLLRWWRTPGGSAWLKRTGDVFQRSWLLWLPVVPLLGVALLLRGKFPQTNALIDDPAFALHYFLLFVLGYVTFAHRTSLSAVVAQRFVALGVVLVLVPLRATLLQVLPPDVEAYSALYVLRVTLRVLAEFSGIVAALGWTSVLLNGTNRFLEWTRPLVYPFYIWHQTVIVVLAFWVVTWPLPWWAKYAVLILASLAGTVGLSELVRRVPLLRAPFGVLERRPSRQAPTATD